MKKTIKNTVLIILFLFLTTSTALLTYLHFFASNDKNLSGTWTAQLDMTERAAISAFGWLQDIEAVTISLEDMETYMQGLTIEVNLNLEQTSRSKGSFHCNISPESYDACNQAAYNAFATAFKELLAERLHMIGYTKDTDEEAVENLVEDLVIETFGMSTVSYLMAYGANLLPPLEDLQAQYDGNGTYEITEDVLVRLFNTNQPIITKTEHYIRKNDSLILSEKNGSEHLVMIYTLQQP